jgi:hypothetical protein
MKIYSIGATIIAILTIIGGIYLFLQYNAMVKQYNGMFSEIESCQIAKGKIEKQLNEAQDQLSKIGKTNDVLIVALNSFMIPGDLKAIAVDSQKTADIEGKINYIADSKDRMMMEQEWSDFRASKSLNSLVDFLRDGVNNIERILAPK